MVANYPSSALKLRKETQGDPIMLNEEFAIAGNAFKTIKKDGHYYISHETEKSYFVELGEEDECTRVSKKDITFIAIPIKEVSPSELRSYYRHEISYEALTGYPMPNNGYRLNGKLDYGFEDLLVAARNCMAHPGFIDTLDPYDLENEIEGDCPNYGLAHMPMPEAFRKDIHYENSAHIAYVYMQEFVNLSNMAKDTDEGFAHLVNEMETLKHDRDEKKNDIPLTKAERNDLAINVSNYDQIHELSQDEVAFISKNLDISIKENEYQAISAKAYLDYEGTEWWPTNYAEAESLLWKLTEKPDSFAYNTLGYLYSYHCPQGAPNYEEAFKCFSIGALGDVAESQYKVADLIMNGQGIKKNQALAKGMYDEIYKPYKRQFIHENYLYKFADIALREGQCYLEGKGCEINKELAKNYLLEAQFAVNKRKEAGGYIGDASVSRRIESSLQLCPKEVEGYSKDEYLLNDDYELDFTLNQFAIGGHYGRISFVSRTEDSCELLVNSDYPGFSSLLVLAKAGLCLLADSVLVRLSTHDKTLDEKRFGEDGVIEFSNIVIPYANKKDPDENKAMFIFKGQEVVFYCDYSSLKIGL